MSRTQADSKLKKNSKFIRLKCMYMETIVGTFSQSFWNSQIHGIKDIDVRDIEIQIVLGNCDFFCRLIHGTLKKNRNLHFINSGNNVYNNVLLL